MVDRKSGQATTNCLSITQPALGEPVMSNQSIEQPVVYKLVADFPGYRVGDDGSVWSCWAHGHNPTSRMTDEWRKLRPEKIKSSGYLMVQLCKNGRRHRFPVHRLILTVFVGPCPPGMEGCHFPDRDRTNNRLSNLRWDTRAKNHADKILHGTNMEGEKHPRARLTDREAMLIFKRVSQGEKTTALAKEYRVDRATVRAIASKKRWKCLWRNEEGE